MNGRGASSTGGCCATAKDRDTAVRRFRRLACLALVLVGGALAPSSVRGQALPTAAAGEAVSATEGTASSLVTGPRVLGAAWGAVPRELVPAQDRLGAGPNVALMAVGGAGLIIGLVIGGDVGMVIASTGGVIGLVGLYRYLK
jgi:hypothetical protein